MSDKINSSAEEPEEAIRDQASLDLSEKPDSSSLTDGQSPNKHRFECRSCGYVYDPLEGVKKFGIAGGTSNEELDEASFRCPVCLARKEAFRDIGPREKPSGFNENLKYGFGANSLTPGQKNVLIFGGLALAVSIFLSLYSLH